jgi:hypothetical protein
VTNGTTYYYVVSPTNAIGTGGNSSEASARPAQTFAKWIATVFPGQTDPLIVGPTSDPDGDGVTNLAEYLFASNPALTDAANAINCTTDALGNIILTFPVAKNTIGITYSVQQSADLVTWLDTGVAATILSDQGTYYSMQATLPRGANSRLFLRLAIFQEAAK